MAIPTNESVYSAMALLFILLTCVELCDAVVDVYCLIRYDTAGVPFRSRLASLNHHAGSSLHSRRQSHPHCRHDSRPVGEVTENKKKVKERNGEETALKSPLHFYPPKRCRFALEIKRLSWTIRSSHKCVVKVTAKPSHDPHRGILG
ncbi:hypothetical protein RHGRI_016723 [Rhododendron griersonianum]|uniref:Secreted protein n=1 Tax=Rhododendron griersonianum TaxID=479676 RepID=A0AAV6JV84_9ERIC|nr:hypothetical protein RHGRI_016723 [Rhododendron griersonianum]